MSVTRLEEGKKDDGLNIVVLGVGFAGLRVILDLSKRLGDLPQGTRITGVDRADRHVYSPLLYEVTTAYVPEHDEDAFEDVKAGSSFSYEELFARMPDAVQFRKGDIETVDVSSKSISFSDGSAMAYDVLVLALGSVPEYFGVPGVEEFGLPLKTVDDALAIRRTLLESISNLRSEVMPDVTLIRVVVAGAGPTGTEMTGEMMGFLRRLEDGGAVEAGSVEVHLINAGETVLTMLHPSTAKKAHRRLERAGVRMYLGKRVTRVDADAAYLDDGSCHPYDVFVWAGGIRGCPIAQDLSESTLTKKGTVEVDSTFRVTGVRDVFSLGDMACFYHPETQTPMPALAQAAIKQGSVVAKNVVLHLQGKELEEYMPPSTWTVALPMAGAYALVDGAVRFSGILAYFVRLFADLRYFVSILPFWKGFKHWRRGSRVYRRNNP